MWNKDSVLNELKKNPYFNNLFEEFIGPYACIYIINKVRLIIFLTVCGNFEIFLLDKPNKKSEVDDIQAFASLAQVLCNDILNEKVKQS